MASHILIVDDEPYMLELIQRLLREKTPHQAHTASSGAEALAWLDRQFFHLALLDLRMPGMDGLELLGEIKRRHSHTQVIIVTAHGTIPSAVEALQQGAADFVTKPFANQALLAVVERVLKLAELTRENLALRRSLAERFDLSRLIGNGPQMQSLAATAAELAQTPVPVFVQGEFGSGRSFLAQALHYSGPRAGEPFGGLDLASVEPQEMEPLLLGRSPDQEPENEGLLASCQGGTLHLAALERLPQALQNRLADWLEQGRFRPPGATHQQSADVRLVASSQDDPQDLVERGVLTPRLGSMLTRFVLRLPPLRARREDIPLLAGRFLEKYRQLYGREVERFSDQAAKWLLAHDWPGNLRELENTMERALLLSSGPVIEPQDLGPPDQVNSMVFTMDPHTLDRPHPDAWHRAAAQFKEAFEERYLSHHLLRGRGDLDLVSASTGLSRQILQEMCARLGISPRRWGGGA